MARRRDNIIPFRKPFKAVPLARVANRPKRRRKRLGITPIMVALPLAVFSVVYLHGVPGADSMTLPAHRPAGPDREAANFTLCEGPVRVNCVVDGDTFWYGGEKIRIADINAPETHDYGCAAELELGNRATDRLLVLLNQGAFTLAPNDDGTGRDRDKYGRLLRTVTRDGDSVGGELVGEGLAETWKGYRRNWC